MHEFELIERYFKRGSGAGVVVGIGDDGAVLQLPAGRELVAVVDTVVSGVHFPRDLGAADIAYRAVAVNLSDIAAMGAVPAWMTLALSLPEAAPDWLKYFADGIFSIADEYELSLVGGDTTTSTELVVSVQLLGHVAPGEFLTRSGCRPGDRVYVSGTLGDAAAGLGLLKNGAVDHALARRFCRPKPRLALGQGLVGLARAAIDVSDGLCADLGHVLAASRCGASIEIENLPISDLLREQCGEEDVAQLALSGGDDYELVFTVSREAEGRLHELATSLGEKITCIGEALAEPGLRVTCAGAPYAGPTRGYRHFD